MITICRMCDESDEDEGGPLICQDCGLCEDCHAHPFARRPMAKAASHDGGGR